MSSSPASHDASPLAPFRQPVFTMLWSTWLVANLCMWMNDVAAAWLMSSLTHSPIWVALVQSAATLPVFLLALPSGALADGLDRKKYFMTTQLWVAVVAGLQTAVVFLDLLTPPLLLLLMFANGIGMAMRWPVFAAILPEVVPRPHLPAALALNSVSMNASRICGPLIAGVIITLAGTVWVFVLNLLLSLMTAYVLTKWKRVHQPHPLGREPLMTSMRVGLQYVAQSRRLKGVLMRVVIFFFSSMGLIALLPLVARGLAGGGATAYTLLLAAMGCGAIASTTVLGRLRSRYSRDGLLWRGMVVKAGVMVGMAWTDQVWLAVPVMVLGGAAWVITANSLNVSFQLSLPDWVRARGMSTYLMAFMGASAAGAALWGAVASWTNVPASIVAAACMGVAAMAWIIRAQPDTAQFEDLSPRNVFHMPITSEPPPGGRVCIHLEYLVAPGRAAEFKTFMLKKTRPARIRQGVLSWELLHDLNEAGRFVEIIVESSWTDYLRRFDRMTNADAELYEYRLSFQVEGQPPKMSWFHIESADQ